ncbi:MULTISPECIES: ATP-grasp domain-containing protein [Rhizobium]|uniref:ATP-grasp domain-containing protein n=1 Tax=Rhizobium TaxID=379 RepID=UPI00161B631D|nr:MULTISPECIES: acetyl-CoA carboxylase biotin carboxylase subunit family protein [Rhizobium]MBB6305588.1 biotin carboxylase [Rhizobium leucaenae]MDK4743619.1 acetyl-CoA carboxylase biotin carboxylase subunit family protein [Rhizobium sp. CNPSo 3464]
MTKRALVLIEGDRGNGPLYIQAARRLGLHPITLSSDPIRYGYLAAEKAEAIHVDTDDLHALIRECSRLRGSYDIVGITGFTALDESLYVTVAKLCRYFDLPGPDPASIEQCCDKCAQRQLLAQANVPIPAYRVATNAADVKYSATEIGMPVIVKPAAGSGSTGVRLCRDGDELAEHTTYLLDGTYIWQSSPKILVEEFILGPYYCTAAMENKVIGIASAAFCPPPYFVFRETTFPAALSHDDYARIADVSLSSLRALDLSWGPTNIELRWTKRGPVVIEVNPRIVGAPDPRLIRLAYGVDLISEHIKLVIGAAWDARATHSQIATARNLVPNSDGILKWIKGASRATAIPGVIEVNFYIEPNTQIVRKGNYQDRIGHVIAASPSHSETEEILQHAVNLIRWSITSFPTAGEQEQS